MSKPILAGYAVLFLALVFSAASVKDGHAASCPKEGMCEPACKEFLAPYPDDVPSEIREYICALVVCRHLLSEPMGDNELRDTELSKSLRVNCTDIEVRYDRLTAQYQDSKKLSEVLHGLPAPRCPDHVVECPKRR